MLRVGGKGFGQTGLNRACAAALVLFIGLCHQQPALAAPAASAVTEHSVAADPDAVADSWSRQDLLSAEPAPMPSPPGAAFDVPSFDARVSAAAPGPFTPPDPTAFPERIQGKVFFDIGLDRYQCSGTLVNSVHGNVVFTAGHCVWDVVTRQFVQNFVFIPGYDSGLSPFNTYAATTLSTPSGYSASGNLSYDIGMATVAGNPEADLGGSRQIAFNLKPDFRNYAIYGYPAVPDPPYNGRHLAGCSSTVTYLDVNTVPQAMGATPCDMRQGASGGGWITDGNYLNSVTSFTYCEADPTTCDLLFGPYFTSAARALYTSDVAGGSVAPTLQVKSSPPRVVRKRRVLFKFAGSGSTPISFQCRLDSRPFINCAANTSVPRLAPGRHVLRVRSADQTGHLSARTIKKTFRVVLRKRH